MRWTSVPSRDMNNTDPTRHAPVSEPVLYILLFTYIYSTVCVIYERILPKCMYVCMYVDLRKSIYTDEQCRPKKLRSSLPYLYKFYPVAHIRTNCTKSSRKMLILPSPSLPSSPTSAPVAGNDTLTQILKPLRFESIRVGPVLFRTLNSMNSTKNSCIGRDMEAAQSIVLCWESADHTSSRIEPHWFFDDITQVVKLVKFSPGNVGSCISFNRERRF